MQGITIGPRKRIHSVTCAFCGSSFLWDRDNPERCPTCKGNVATAHGQSFILTRSPPQKGSEVPPRFLCAHCGGDIRIRNPKGFCDHLYYPENCPVCEAATHD